MTPEELGRGGREEKLRRACGEDPGEAAPDQTLGRACSRKSPWSGRQASFCLNQMPAQGHPSDEMVPAAKSENVDLKGGACSRIWQNPRFVAKKRGSMVEIKCYTDDLGNVSWLRKQETDLEPKPLLKEDRIQRTQNGSVATLIIRGIQFQDNGIYFCLQNCLKGPPTQGCGTELRVMGFSTLEQLKRRNTLKDGIIMIQTLLITLFIIVPIFLLLDKDDSKAGMEEDHTYEGLDIDQTATYEDIVTLRTGEVKWSVGEHPGQE